MDTRKCHNVLEEVFTERLRQHQKFGEQNHANGIWSMILGEEFGEVSQAALQAKFPHFASIKDKPLIEASGISPEQYYLSSLRKELIEVAAVAVAWVEKLDRET